MNQPFDLSPRHPPAIRRQDASRCAVVVGVCRLSLYFPESGSLKGKRQGLRRVKERVRAKFNAAVAEVSGQDSWKHAALGICVVGNDGGHVQSMIDKIIYFVGELYLAQIVDREVELLHYGEREPLGIQGGGGG